MRTLLILLAALWAVVARADLADTLATLDPVSPAFSRAQAVASVSATPNEQVLRTPVDTPVAYFLRAGELAQAARDAGLDSVPTPHPMTPLGALWARLNQRLAREGMTPALYQAYLAYFKHFTQNKKETPNGNGNEH